MRRKLSLRASGVRMDPAACDLRTAWMIGYRARQRAEAGRVAAELVKAS